MKCSHHRNMNQRNDKHEGNIFGRIKTVRQKDYCKKFQIAHARTY